MSAPPHRRRDQTMAEAEDPDLLALRDIRIGDAGACADLSGQVGWPHRREDWEFVIGLGGGVVCLRRDAVVASALWWPYGEGHATLGGIIVAPQAQGAGIGRRLMQGLFAQAQGRSLMLNATAAGEPLYASSGFAPCGGVRQQHGRALPVAAPELGAGERLRSADAGDLAALGRLDREASGLDRGPALAALLRCSEAVVLERGGRPVGFSMLRAFGLGQAIGPVIAADEADARMLIACWLHGRAGWFMRVDIPLQSVLGDWLERLGLVPAGDVVTMVRGALPKAAGPARVHALINQALG